MTVRPYIANSKFREGMGKMERKKRKVRGEDREKGRRRDRNRKSLRTVDVAGWKEEGMERGKGGKGREYKKGRRKGGREEQGRQDTGGT